MISIIKKYRKSGLRKIAYLSIISTLILTEGYSQTDKVQVGIKVIPDFSNINHKNISNDEKKFSMSGGIQVVKNISNFFGLESGVYLITRGYQFENLNIVKHNLQYLSVPLILRGRIKNFYLGAGPSIDYFLDGYDKSPGLKYHFNSTPKVIFSVPLSLGYEKIISKRILFFGEVRYNSTLTKIMDFGAHRAYNYGLGVGGRYLLR